jgi:hypothetical protein
MSRGSASRRRFESLRLLSRKSPLLGKPEDNALTLSSSQFDPDSDIHELQPLPISLKFAPFQSSALAKGGLDQIGSDLMHRLLVLYNEPKDPAHFG